jgi:hypothetical protein
MPRLVTVKLLTQEKQSEVHMWRALQTAIFGGTTRRRSRAVSNDTSQIWWPPASDGGPHGFTAVVGESFYQDTLQRLDRFFDEGERGFLVRLVPEPSNAHDPTAVAVFTEETAKIGYLSRDVAERFHKVLLRQPKPVYCPAKLIGRGYSHVGVVLDFNQVRRLN